VAIQFTVVVPTRDRADTLLHTLKTCVMQNYDNLTILVSDCFSSDHTKDVVHSFHDHRIKYVNPGKRLSMPQHWEFALSHVTGGYLTYVGDDDGLLPDAITGISTVLAETNSKALAWLKVEYHWPDHIIPQYRNLLRVPLRNVLTRYDSRVALRDVVRMWLPYNRTPCVYNSAVEYGLIKRIRDRTGTFFNCMTPDVYSGFALLSVLDSYLYSSRPFTLNGASGQSTGTSQFAGQLDKRPIEKFMSELDPVNDDSSWVVAGSLTSSVADALRKANHSCFDGRIRLNEKRILRRIVKEISGQEERQYTQSYEQLEKLAAKTNLVAYAKILKGRHPCQPRGKRHIELGVDDREVLTLDAGLFGIGTVHSAALLAGQIVSSYSMPEHVRSYSGYDKVISRALRLLCGLQLDRSL
jgi:glycosyl transferase family 2